MEHLSLEERLLVAVALRLELADIVSMCLLLLHKGRRRLFATFVFGFGLLDLDLASLVVLLRFRCERLVCAGGGLAGVIVFICVCFDLLV